MTEPNPGHAWSVLIHKDMVLNANATKGKHWGASSPQIADLRTLGIVQSRRLPRFDRVRCDVTVSYPDRVERDAMNLYPTMKAYVDGLVNCTPGTRQGRGILHDDSDFYLEGPFIRWSGKRSTSSRHFEFRIVLTPLEPLEWDRDAVGKAALARMDAALQGVGYPTV